MALQKQPVAINFTQGLQTKTDPYQIPIGNFAELQNSVFNVTGRLTKRTGFDNITELPNTEQTILTTLNDNLIATGSNIFTFSATTNDWIEQGKIQPVQLSTQSIVRSSTGQDAPDIALSDSGLMVVAYMDTDGESYYHVTDSNNGQQIIPRTQLPSAMNPRVFKLNAYFIITFIADVLGTPTLQYIAVNTINPTMVGPATTISADVNALDAGYDGQALTNALYLAWGASASAVKIVYLNASLNLSAEVSISGNTADIMSLTIDTDAARVYISYWEESSQDGYSASFTYPLAPAMDATQIIDNINIRQISSIPRDGDLQVFYETVNTYDYLPNASSDFISKLFVTPPVGSGTGTVSSPDVVLRSVGITSKPFQAENGSVYMMAAYGNMDQNQSPSQMSNEPTYFLIDDEGDIYMRLAGTNAGGYATRGNIPKVNVLSNAYYVPYELTSFLATVNKGTDIPEGQPVNAIYTQQGINLAKFMLNIGDQHSSEIAGCLHLTGGQLWQFDTVKPVEHGFHVYPENIGMSSPSTIGNLTPQVYFYSFTYEWTDNQGNLHRSAPSIPYKFDLGTPPDTVTADLTEDSTILTDISSFTDLMPGQILSNTYLSEGTYIVSIDEENDMIVISQPALSTRNNEVLDVFAASGIVLNVPTLRVTAKTSDNPVRIVGYRWSEAQQTYYQFTSITNPYVNDTTIDSIEVTDTFSDAEILGQTILYTTGGVLENIAAPASVDSCLFDNRLWLIPAEDPNLLWFSKQVIQNVPVEMSDLLTLYVAPTTGAEASTGPMRCIASMDDKLIIFKDNALYYVNGNGPDITGANNSYSQPVYITGVAGSSNPNSIALIPQGLMFQSNKGIWLLGRDLSTKYIGSPVEAYNDLEVLSAEVIPDTTQVRLIMEENVTLVYDYFYDQWATHNNIRAISSVIYQGQHTYLNTEGEVFQQNPESYKDGAESVLLKLKTPWINVAGLQGFERFYEMLLLGTYYTPFKLQIEIAYDYNPSPTQSIIVTPDNYTPNWGDEAVWGSGGPWGGPGNPFKARVFPEKQKCEAFQITITEVYDPSYGVASGQGLSLSGINMEIGVKKSNRTQAANRSFG